MTRRRMTVFVLGICVGTLLLLFGDAVAEVTEASATEKSDFQKASIPKGATTIPTRLSPVRQDQPSRERNGQNIEVTSRNAHDKEDGSRVAVNSDESASRGGEKSDPSTSRNASDDTSSRATKSSEDTESSSSSDGSRKPRYGEISAESTGKSTSTKVVSEDPLRLSRTNELTIASAKPALNESRQDGKKSPGNATLHESSDREETSNANKAILPGVKETLANEKPTANIVKSPETKRAEIMPTVRAFPKESSVNYDERRNVTVNTEEIMNVKSVGDISMTFATSPVPEHVVKIDEKKEKIVKSDYAEVIPRIELKRDRDASLTDRRDREDAEDRKPEDRDRELTTVRGIRHENSPGAKKHAVDLGTTASEAFDLEKIDEKGHEGTVSLINDTYVNYKNLAGKDPKASQGNHSDANGSRVKGDPKEEVEVVKNVTHQPILKIVAIPNDTKRGEAGAKDEDYQERRVVPSATNATVESTDGTEARKSIGEPESQVKLPETTTQSFRSEDRISTTLEVVPSPVPQGRTIGFSGVNEFPSIEVKSTASTPKIVGESETASSTQSSRKNSSTDAIDQRPYPYLKSNKEPSAVMTDVNLKNNDGDVTEETSAYENTIGREESEKKFVVTEPSVVIENSIQQQKSNEKSMNESTNSSTESPSLVSATVIPITSDNVRPTNETFPDGSNSGARPAEMKGSKSKENDMPNTKEREKVIASKDEGYDVTGNGITELSSTPGTYGRDEEAKSRSTEAMGSSTSRSTAGIPKTSSLNTDIQTEPEEAMMIRSTLVVTESTMVPSDKDTATEVNKTTSTTTSVEFNTLAAAMVLENSTESSPPKTNGTIQQLSTSENRTNEPPFTTLNPDESSIPTTTSVEFEFIGLTEAGVSSGGNATERKVEERIFVERTTPTKITNSTTTMQDTSVRINSTEETITAMKTEESTVLPATTEDGTPTTDQVSVTDKGITAVRDPSVTRPAVVEQLLNRTDFIRNEVTTNAADFTSVSVVDVGTATGVTEDPSGSKDTSFDANVTETLAPGVTELSPDTIVTISSATNVTKDLSFATSTLEPRVLWSTSGFTESPEDETTEGIQTLSPDEITLLVKIVIEGGLHEVCPHLQDLRKALADVLTNSIDNLVLPKQIVIHQNPCLEPTGTSPTSTDVSLTSILVYVVDEDGKFDAATTKILPSLYKVLHNFPVKIHKFLLVQETDSGNAIAVVVVSSVAFICLVLLAGLLFIMRKRQTRFNYGERCRPVSLDAYSLDSVSAYNSVRRKGAARSSKRSYGNPTFEDSSAIPSHPLNFAGLSSFCNDVNAINEEFSNIPQVSAKIDELPTGAEVKNRYANVVPLPETRVPLQRLNNDALTEYINASYVRGPKNATKYYIACQAPIESTVTDFWRMIWEQQCKVIIMLTDLVENGVEKCTEYIPPSEVTDCHRLYGDYQVTLKKREAKEKYAISTLHLKNLENNTFREVFHIWYLWPVSGVQSDGAGLIAVLLEARALQRGGPGPIVVHCSPGTGRTGTLIALDLGIRQYEITRTVDVPRVVYTIRRDRAGAVQTKEQYAFIYKALNLYATKLAGGVLEST